MHDKTAVSAHHVYDSQAGRLKASEQQLAANLMYAAGVMGAPEWNVLQVKRLTGDR